MSELFPQQFRHLADLRSSRLALRSRRDVRGAWVLDIAGPFSFYPPAKANRRAEQVADMVSSLLCMAVRHRLVDGAVYIIVESPAVRRAGA